MKRTIQQWRDSVPAAMAEMSKSAQAFAFDDAKSDILELHRKLEAAQSHANQLRRALNAQHAHHSEDLNVFFEKNGMAVLDMTNLGEAYQESGLCEKTLKALTASDEQAIAAEKEFVAKAEISNTIEIVQRLRTCFLYLRGVEHLKAGRWIVKREAKRLHKETGLPVFNTKVNGNRVQISAEELQ